MATPKMTEKLSNEDFANATGAEMVRLAPGEIHVDDSRNLRKYAPDAKGIESLSRDIVEKGQLQPVVVAVNGDGMYTLVAGFRRYKAITLANENGAGLQILARVVHADTHQAMLDNLSENLKRENLSPIDMAAAIKTMRDSGMTSKDIAREFGKSDSWVRQVEPMLELSPDKQKAIHRGDIPFGIARQLVGLNDAEQTEVLEAVEHAKVIGEGSHKAAEAARQKLKGKQAGGKKDPTETRAGKTGVSAKSAILSFENQIEEMGKAEKLTKAETKTLDVYKFVTKFLAGRIGLKVLHKNLIETVG
jgi:ParB/RepB/Spo0J family partition protein